MSTPKVCAQPTFLRVMNSTHQAIDATEVRDRASKIFYNDSHLFHRSARFKWRHFNEPISRLDETEQMNDLRGDACVL